MSNARRATVRLFAAYAVISMVPIALLGLVLAGHFRQEARRDGLIQGRAQAQLIAQTAIEPQLDGRPLSSGLTAREHQAVAELTRRAMEPAGDGPVRLRLRDLAGRVVYSSDASTDDVIDRDALRAAAGHSVTRLTTLNGDSGHGRPGPATIEVYLPLSAGAPAHRVGVLELYLSYAPIQRQATRLLSTMYRDLLIGLALLYVVLFVVTASVGRRGLRQSQLNAHLAAHDPLTGLPNRAEFQRQVAAALEAEQRPGESLAIAIVDLDRFKDINETLGHRNGDEVLCELARRLDSGSRGVDGMTVARLGGDEFGVLLPCGSDPSAELSAVRHALEADLSAGGLTLAAQASIGYALAPADGHDVHTLMQHADVAMYLAKEDHAGVTRYDAARDQYDADSLRLVSELRQAIEADQLVLHYQPQRNVGSGRIATIEALVRWQHPTLGLLYPDKFLPLAEQTDLIDRLTRWVLTRALTDLERLGPAGSRLSVAVNVSARGIGRGALADDVIEALKAREMPGERLVIEVTETAIMTDPARAAIELARLSDAGVRISLDDFGQGQTSLGYLSALPLDELKIDRAFVGDMLNRPADRAIVHSIVDLGHNLGLRVVAEGVETEDVLGHLADRGCDVIQGYLLARPMDLAALSRWLSPPAKLSPAVAAPVASAPASSAPAPSTPAAPVVRA